MNKYFLTPPSDNEIVLNNIIEQIYNDSSSSTHEIASLSSSAKPGGLTYHTNIILGKEYDRNDIRYIRKGRNLQMTLAQELCNQLEEYNKNYFTLDDIKNLEKVLNIQIKVVAAECFNSIIYSGNEKDVKVYLYKNGNHFDTISSMTAFHGESYYCEKCDKPYQNKDGHKCKTKDKICVMCFKSNHKEDSSKRIYCEKCNRYCFNQECLENHSEVCERFHKCLKCNKILKRGDKMIEEGNNKKGSKEHRCGWEKCRNCYKEVEILKHKRYMQSKRQKGGICQTTMKDDNNIYKVKGCKNCDRKGCTVTFPDKTNMRVKYHIYQCKKCKTCVKKPLDDEEPFVCVDCGSRKHTNNCTYTEKYLFFNYEAMQETGKHIANLVISHDFSGNVNSFKTNEDFCKWLISRDHRGHTAIAHYSKGYDSYFILKYCVENGIKPFCVYNGSKIMLMEIKSINLRIIDSSNFVQGPLKNFPKTFGLKELKKGYFPHFFNTTENQNYIGKIPDAEYYGVSSMKPKEREEFLEWHKQKEKKIICLILKKNFMIIVILMLIY
jgi:hypothetical protein